MLFLGRVTGQLFPAFTKEIHKRDDTCTEGLTIILKTCGGGCVGYGMKVEWMEMRSLLLLVAFRNVLATLL